MGSTIGMRRAFVPELATISVVVLVALAAARVVLSMARARLLVLLPGLNVNVSTGPEPVITRPLVRLSQQSQCAIITSVVIGQSDIEALGCGIAANEL